MTAEKTPEKPRQEARDLSMKAKVAMATAAAGLSHAAAYGLGTSLHTTETEETPEAGSVQPTHAPADDTTKEEMSMAVDSGENVGETIVEPEPLPEPQPIAEEDVFWGCSPEEPGSETSETEVSEEIAFEDNLVDSNSEPTDIIVQADDVTELEGDFQPDLFA